MEGNKKILKIGVMGCRMGGAHAKCFKALEDYAVHPLHLEAKKNFHHFIGTRTAADYEF